MFDSKSGRWARQRQFKITQCDCGMLDSRLGLKKHSETCARVLAMNGLIKMREAGILNELHTFPSSAGAGYNWKPKETRFQISKQNRRLGYWNKDFETGRWLLTGIEQAVVDGKIIPLSIFREGKKHG